MHVNHGPSACTLELLPRCLNQCKGLARCISQAKVQKLCIHHLFSEPPVAGNTFIDNPIRSIIIHARIIYLEAHNAQHVITMMNIIIVIHASTNHRDNIINEINWIKLKQNKRHLSIPGTCIRPSVVTNKRTATVISPLFLPRRQVCETHLVFAQRLQAFNNVVRSHRQPNLGHGIDGCMQHSASWSQRDQNWSL